MPINKVLFYKDGIMAGIPDLLARSPRCAVRLGDSLRG